MFLSPPMNQENKEQQCTKNCRIWKELKLKSHYKSFITTQAKVMKRA